MRVARGKVTERLGKRKAAGLDTRTRAIDWLAMENSHERHGDGEEVANAPTVCGRRRKPNSEIRDTYRWGLRGMLIALGSSRPRLHTNCECNRLVHFGSRLQLAI